MKSAASSCRRIECYVFRAEAKDDETKTAARLSESVAGAFLNSIGNLAEHRHMSRRCSVAVSVLKKKWTIYSPARSVSQRIDFG